MDSAPTLVDPRYKNPDNDPRGAYLLSDLTAPFDRPAMTYELNGHIPPAGRSWRYSQEATAGLELDGRIVFPLAGSPRLKRYLSEMIPESKAWTATEASSRLERIVRTAMKALASEIANNPRMLRHVEWRDLERVMREVFEELGFSTELTRPAQDGGFDLRLETIDDGEPRVFLVEIKHWLPSGQKPGSKALSALIDVVARVGGPTKGLLLSTSGFTRNILNGRTEVEQHSVRIAGQSKIVSLCQSYLESTEGIWLPTTHLSEMLLQGSK